MQGLFERIKNFNVSIKEESNQILFLRKLIPGSSEHSFGIHVAKMAWASCLESTKINAGQSITN